MNCARCHRLWPAFLARMLRIAGEHGLERRDDFPGPGDGEAEGVRDDLQRHPANGWSLYGLARALEVQKSAATAAKVDEQFKQAWRDADMTLTSSAF